MRKSFILLLKITLIMFALIIIAGMIRLPQTEGRNINSDPIALYFNDPFLAYVYLGSIPFFVAIYQAVKLSGYIGQKKTFSKKTADALAAIKKCALALIGFIAGAMLFIFFGPEEDITGIIVFTTVLIIMCGLVAISATILHKYIIQVIQD